MTFRHCMNIVHSANSILQTNIIDKLNFMDLINKIISIYKINNGKGDRICVHFTSANKNCSENHETQDKCIVVGGL